jgi:bifunctional DNA-binding transcriptional regulator/antitoxin component of YhaV-PrlF toxin-antitoxin module
VKLQKVVNRVRGENTYHRFQVVLPSEQVEALGWDGGEELEAVKRGDSLVLRRAPVRKG